MNKAPRSRSRRATGSPAEFIPLGAMMFLAIPLMVVLTGQGSHEEAQAAAEAHVEQLAASESPDERQANAFIRERFLTLIDQPVWRTVRRGIPRRNRTVRARPEDVPGHIGMTQYDIEALREGRRPVAAREMLALCDLLGVAVADFLNPDYPLDMEARQALDDVPAAEWVRDTAPAPNGSTELEAISAAEWVARRAQ